MRPARRARRSSDGPRQPMPTQRPHGPHRHPQRQGPGVSSHRRLRLVISWVGRRVAVGGLSAGGTMALDLALRRRPAALLLFGTALAMANRFAYVTPYLWRFVRSWPSPASDMVDLNAGAACYDPVPLRAVAELI